ncbi:uncharacterized protein LOC142333181 [Lycorma delicatula]|uniref:uncharacterized protein LOC142333181 n=1 Tax=Lycorma delicatula TaxID=130591 RepID=UPI003F514DE8
MNQIYEDNQVMLEVFIYLFWNISTVLLLLKTSTLITENSENFINILLSQPISHLDEGVQQEILLFIQQARDAKQEITAYDFFTVNNKTIFVLVGQILTYFIFWGQEDVNN